MPWGEAWAKASFNFCKQLAIRFGVLDPRAADPPMPPPLEPRHDYVPLPIPLPIHPHDPIPDEFNPENLGSLCKEQVAWWDETHHQCSLRSRECVLAQVDTVTSFPRSKDGKLDEDHGEYRTQKPSNMKVNYEKEVRLALIVAVVWTIDNKLEGRRYKAFGYTNKMIVPDA